MQPKQPLRPIPAEPCYVSLVTTLPHVMSRLGATRAQKTVLGTGSLVRQALSAPSELEDRSAWCLELRSKNRKSLPWHVSQNSVKRF